MEEFDPDDIAEMVETEEVEIEFEGETSTVGMEKISEVDERGSNEESDNTNQSFNNNLSSEIKNILYSQQVVDPTLQGRTMLQEEHSRNRVSPIMEGTEPEESEQHYKANIQGYTSSEHD